MSKELVISASSHERRVAILEEGQLVEIYIEREKEFALVGSIYKGKVTRVLPGMQSAFVDIGLDGDAFLYVSDVFENLEDYEHSQPHEQPDQHLPAPAVAQGNGSTVELLPGESLARASERHEEAHGEELHPQPPAEHEAVSPEDAAATTGQAPGHSEEQPAGEQLASGEGPESVVIAAAVSRAARVDEIFLPRSMLRRKAANFAAMTIAVASSAVMTIAARKARAVRAHRPRISAKKPFFFPANRSQNTATRPRRACCAPSPRAASTPPGPPGCPCSRPAAVTGIT